MLSLCKTSLLLLQRRRRPPRRATLVRCDHQSGVLALRIRAESCFVQQTPRSRTSSKLFPFVRVTVRYSFFALFFCRYITRYFSGGQQCDETQKGRKSEVQIHCCASRSHLPPHLLSVEEPSKCKCVPRNSSSCPSLFLFIRKCPLILKICLRFAFPSFMHRYVLKVCAPSMCAADVAQSSADEPASSMVAAAARASLNLDENGRVRGDEAGVSFFLS